ncbi:MAG: hypothetical protein QM594_11540 [Niabella sp.]
MKSFKVVNVFLLLAFSAFLVSQLFVQYNSRQSTIEPGKSSSPADLYKVSELIADSSLFYSDKEEEKLVVLRLVKNQCGACVESALENIKDLSRKLGKDKVAIWASGSFKEDELVSYQRLFRYDVPKFYQIKSVIDPLDSHNQPYFFYFTRDKFNIMQLVFFPYNKSLVDRTNYFKLLEQKML